MADAAVRVDIVVGQNTVVPAVQQTERALGGASRSAGAASAGFESLSRKGLKSVEIGFRQLAFQAAGVPGPMGKIAEGALLLGGGSGLLLGVAAAAGAVALAWQAMTKHSRELTQAIKDLQEQLPKNDKPAEDLAKLWKEYGDMMRRATELEAKANRPGAMFSAPSLLADAAALRVKAAELKKMLEVAQLTVPAMGGVPADQPERRATRSPQLAETGEMVAAWARNEEFVKQSQQINLMAQAYAQLNATASQTPAIMDGIAAAMDGIEQGLVDANAGFIQSLELSRQLMEDMQNIFLQGFMDLATGLAEALGSGGSFGDVLLRALGGLFQQMGQALIAYGIAMLKLLPALLNPFTSGAAAIAAGAALVAIGAALTKIATKSGPSGHAASGGVSAGGYARDQQQVAAMGTVTVKMGDGFIRASDPAFQEFLAEVIKQGKGRNVVFA